MNRNITCEGSDQLTYDAENQLVDYTIPGSYRTAYDGRGRLRQRTEYNSAGGTNWTFSVQITYLYDGRRVIQERNGTTPTVAYTRGHDLAGSLEGAGGIGGLLARTHGYSAGNWSTHHYYHADGNGNVTYLVNSSQGLGCSYRYKPYGELLGSSTGTLTASANAYRFSSKEWMNTSGLYYYGYRFYQPTLQRWINRDPIMEEGGINLYTFVGNNPIRNVDALGLANVCNNTGQPLLVSGNAGRNHGAGMQRYGVIPPRQKGGGPNDPIPSYPTPEDALAAFHNPSMADTQAPLIYDVDNIYPLKGPEKKLPGDEKGPTYDVNKDGSTDAHNLTVPGAYIRRAAEKLVDFCKSLF